MNSEQRKEKFVILLQELLDRAGGVKGKLAETLHIKPSTLTGWLQGKVDPASLEIIVFLQLSEVKDISIDRLTGLLGINIKNSEISLYKKFRTLIKQLLSHTSQQELADLLQVSQNAVSTWTNPEKNIDPRKMTIATMQAIAYEKGWTIEKLLVYLGLKKNEPQKDLLFQVQSTASQLSFNDRLKLLAWLADLLQKQVTPSDSNTDKYIIQQAPISNSKILIVLEKEDLSLASFYSTHLVLNLQSRPENIKIATIAKLSSFLDNNTNILIFDISIPNSQVIRLIQNLHFDGDIIIFTSPVRSNTIKKQLAEIVTDIVIKPIDWLNLKNKSYFQKY